jgi:hypothetical protein
MIYCTKYVFENFICFFFLDPETVREAPTMNFIIISILLIHNQLKWLACGEYLVCIKLLECYTNMLLS